MRHAPGNLLYDGALRVFATRGDGDMSTLQAFLLGMMVAWTISLILLAFILRDRPFCPDEGLRDEENGAFSSNRETLCAGADQGARASSA